VSQERLIIAVVDDEEPVRKALERLLRSADYEVATFESGEAFLHFAKAAPPDCLVLDLHMPGLSGFEVQVKLAAINPAVPVVVITGHDLPGAEERARAGGALAYLCKPINDRVLLRAIEFATEHAASEQ
jgi:FixJ family two-component response regulator